MGYLGDKCCKMEIIKKYLRFLYEPCSKHSPLNMSLHGPFLIIAMLFKI